MSKVVPNNAIDVIRQSGANSLPDNPSQSGYNAKQIKNAIERPNVTLARWLSALEEKLDFDPASVKVVTTLPESFTDYSDYTVFLHVTEDNSVKDVTVYVLKNGSLTQIGDSIDTTAGQIDILQSYFTSGKANYAIRDGSNRNIVDTYATKTELSGEVTKFKDGTYTAKKAEKDADGNTITSTYGKLASTNNWTGTNVFKTINLSYDGGGGTVASFTKDLPVIATGGSYGAGNITKYYLPYDQSNLPAGYTTFTVSTSYDVANAKAEALASAASTAQGKVDALASALGFSNGAFGTIVAALLKVTKMEVTDTETKTATLEDQFLEMLAGNTVAYGTNYVGFVFTKYDATNDFFVGIYNDTLMIGDCTATRSNGKITSLTPISLEPLMSRVASSSLTDGHLIEWDSDNHCAKDAAVTASDILAVLTQEAARVLAEQGRVTAEGARVTAETERALQEKYRVINHPYPITQAEYVKLTGTGVFGVHLSTPLQEGDDPELVATVYDTEALARAANEKYVFKMQDHVQYPPKDVGGDAPYLSFPAFPVEDGTYIPKLTVSGGVATIEWEAVE